MAQSSSYTIAFTNAAHHEADVTASFKGFSEDTLVIRMSRTSPGRYAVHEFAKNVYRFSATDSEGRPVNVKRPDPYSWAVSGHNGTVNIRYTLFADRGDGTYSQIDETHAHLNIPATFLYAPVLSESPIEVTFTPRDDLGWKVATQLPLVKGTTYSAPNLQYFMDSPVEISDYRFREFTETSGGKKYTIQFVLHHPGSEPSLDSYMEQVERIVSEEKEIFGELPAFDYGRYTFLACYMPNVSGDGMEHRNSTVLTSTLPLEEGGMAGNIGTVSHEFFHAWNVERIRPESLEPFNFEAANMSGALWFAEGFTSYYTNLVLCRADIISPETYLERLAPTFNYVWNSPARLYFNPIEMSYQAPFVDAATSIDPVNRGNTFISYYSYGHVLALALDLQLRKENLTLDGYLQLLWLKFGRNEFNYTVTDLHMALNEYAGKVLGDRYFESFIYNSGMPDYEGLFEYVGVTLKRDQPEGWLGITTGDGPGGHPLINEYSAVGSPAYNAGLEKGDILVELNGIPFVTEGKLNDSLPRINPGDRYEIQYKRGDKVKSTTLEAVAHPSYSIYLSENKGSLPSSGALQARKDWLKQD
jgi:predicted metalloprotease with PDZ domain